VAHWIITLLSTEHVRPQITTTRKHRGKATRHWSTWGALFMPRFCWVAINTQLYPRSRNFVKWASPFRFICWSFPILHSGLGLLREGLDSNLGYIEWRFFVVFLCPSRTILEILWKSFPIYLLLYHSTLYSLSTNSAGRAIAQAVSRGGPGYSPGQVMWDSWWTKWHWDRFVPSTLVSPVNSNSTDCSTLIIIIIIIIYYPGLVQ
jgi:hypothetical protein